MTEATAKAIQVSVEEIETFEHQGYLVLDEFLPADLVSHLSERLKEAIERRKAGAKPSQGAIHRDGNDIRIMHILNDDSVFLKLVDHPPMVAYVQALLQEEFHGHQLLSQKEDF